MFGILGTEIGVGRLFCRAACGPFPEKTPGLSSDPLPRWKTVAEVMAVVVLFFLLGGGSAPEINEAHYLAKAKHFWNPQWCPQDHFLNSADAHYLFYLTWGGLTRWLSLEATAWIGRLTAWLLLAIAWCRLSRALVPRWGCALLSAGLWTSLVQRCHMSGEWVIGGIEAKVLAYALVLLGIAEVIRGLWSRAWLLLGSAAAFHALVGGWTVVTALFSWALQPTQQRTSLTRMAPALFAGGLLSLPGLLPALGLSWQADPDTAAAACRIYVFDRLRHHLLLSEFPPAFILRHMLLSVAFLVMAWPLRTDQRFFRLTGCVCGAMLMALVGGLLEFLGNSNLLRLYWFRATDVLVPMGIALAAIVWIQRWSATRPRAAAAAISAAIVLLSAHVVQKTVAAPHAALPAADRQGHVRSKAQLHDWQEACQWTEQNLAPGVCLLTPDDHQTFKWYAGRSEVVTWKDIPQNADGIIQWQQRREKVAALRHLAETASPAQVQQRLREIAEEYEFEFCLVRSSRRMPLQGLRREFQNRYYTIYRVRP
jgi:hypothetical protein